MFEVTLVLGEVDTIKVWFCPTEVLIHADRVTVVLEALPQTG